MSNLWILSEERPKEETISFILEKLCRDKNISFYIPGITIIPIIKENKFTFTYQVIGPFSPQIRNIMIKIIKGKSSFVDYLVFIKENPPSPEDIPIYAIEETKTTSSDSRNTSVFQRASKFVYLDTFYPSNKTKKIMLYHYDRPDNKKKASTFYFGIQILKTLDIEVSFLNSNNEAELVHQIEPFHSIEELIEKKNELSSSGPSHNIPLHIKKMKDKILISSKLDKGTGKYKGKISHDPNIGAVTALSACLRKLGWEKDIVIINHGINNIPEKTDNKFTRIANALNIKMKGVKIPETQEKKLYWDYDLNSEKNVTILTHITIEKFYQNGQIIFENHAGSGLGFFILPNGEKISVNKHTPKPDIVAKDEINKEIINIEGERLKNFKKGIHQLKEQIPKFEEEYIRQYYPEFTIIRSLIAFDDSEKKRKLFQKLQRIFQNKKIHSKIRKTYKDIDLIHIILSKDGELLFNEISCPKMLKSSFNNLSNFWQEKSPL